MIPKKEDLAEPLILKKERNQSPSFSRNFNQSINQFEY